jgi:Homeodomain
MPNCQARFTKKDSKCRSKFTNEHLAVLRRAFLINDSPSRTARIDLALELNTALTNITTWFQNRRQQVKLKEERRIAREAAALLKASTNDECAND